jgi:hypothetical protein
MKNTKETKTVRPSKKVLIAKLEARGVAKGITTSLMRSNIETIEYVISLGS